MQPMRQAFPVPPASIRAVVEHHFPEAEAAHCRAAERRHPTCRPRPREDVVQKPIATTPQVATPIQEQQQTTAQLQGPLTPVLPFLLWLFFYASNLLI